MTTDYAKPEIRNLLFGMIRAWGPNFFTTVWRTRSLQRGIFYAARRRKKIEKKEGITVPFGIGISPTNRCNLTCRGCYARFHRKSEEMSIETIEKLVSEAVSMGVFLFIITGGEPYMRPEMFSIYRRYRQALFITVSNGTLIDEACAERIAACGNIIPVLSIEGTEALTDAKRGRGTYQKVINAMARLKRRKILFGFSSVLTAHSIDVLGSKTFIETMLRQGCSVGFYNDHVPFEQEDYADLPAEEALSDFRSRLAVLRRSYPLVLVHLPDDEYDENNRCTAVKDGAVHVNAQGFAEPCPFAHYARENVMFSSFRQVLSSPFLSAIKKHPNALEKGAVGCALACKQQLLAELAEKTGAVPTKSIPNPESAAAEKTGG